jgi:hypothetical protein
MDNSLTIRGTFTAATPSPDDRSLIERICAAYHYSCSAFGRSDAVGESQWSIINGFKSTAHEILISGGGAAELLRFPCSNNLFYGFDSLYASHVENLRANPAQQDGEAFVIAQAIERLAQSIGVVRAPNPEALDRLPPQDRSIETLLSRIATETDPHLSFPNPFPDEFGIPTSRGTISMRPLFGIYQAYRLNQILSMSRDKRILEIGAGLGRTAFYAYNMGLRDYAIIDLPLANASQAYFLGRTIGQENIALAGETNTAAVRILPPSSLDDLRIGVVLNVDSLTEMDRSFADRYVSFARDRAEIFVSINHEVNSFTANEVIRSAMPNAVMMRYEHPMRPGYIEEIVFQRAAG